ncbi:MAG: hypothetical protein ACNA8W_24675 [Bradymonadaceae bacterium]
MAEIDIQRRRSPMWPWIFGIVMAIILIVLLVATRDTTDAPSPYGAGPDVPETGPLLPPGQPPEPGTHEPDDQIEPERWRDEQPGPESEPIPQPGVRPDPSLVGPRGGGPFGDESDFETQEDMERERGSDWEDGYEGDGEIEYGGGDEDVELFGPSPADGRHPGPYDPGDDLDDDEGVEDGVDRTDETDEFGAVDEGAQDGVAWEEVREVVRENRDTTIRQAPAPVRDDHRLEESVEYLAEDFHESDYGENPDAIDDFSRFVEEREAYGNTPVGQDYASAGIHHLAAALATLSNQFPPSTGDGESLRHEIDEQADGLREDEGEAAPGDLTRDAFTDAADWLRAIQEEYFPDLEAAIDELDEAAAAINGEEDLRDQSDQVDTFFARVQDVISRMYEHLEGQDLIQ